MIEGQILLGDFDTFFFFASQRTDILEQSGSLLCLNGNYTLHALSLAFLMPQFSISEAPLQILHWVICKTKWAFEAVSLVN